MMLMSVATAIAGRSIGRITEPVAAQRAGAVDLGRLQHVVRDGLQPGEADV